MTGTRVRIIIGLLILVLTAGCVRMAYYNTYYNAVKYFEEAQDIPLRNNRPNSEAVRKYNDSMKKCGIILTELKKSSRADDALFLLAKCLYYQKSHRKLVDGKSKFEDLIQYYPKSEFVPEAKIYIIKIEYELDNKSDAFKKIKEYLLDDNLKKYHPEVLFLAADYQMEEENILQSRAYLRKLLDNYPKSDYINESYILLSESFYNEKDYVKSINVLDELLKKRTKKSIKFDAMYRKAVNNLELENYNEVLKTADYLIKKEIDPEKVSQAKILKARALMYTDETELAGEILENVIKTNRSGEINSMAYFYKAELNFFILLNYEEAMKAYNKVNSSFELYKFAKARSAIASQILQFRDSERTISLEDLVEEQFKLAEYYFDVLEAPDSALKVYDNILFLYDQNKLKLDTLKTKISEFIAQKDTMSYLRIDSLSIAIEATENTKDSLYSFIDTLAVKKDSTYKNDLEDINRILNELISRQDSINAAKKSLQANLEQAAKKQKAANAIDSMIIDRRNKIDSLVAADSTGNKQKIRVIENDILSMQKMNGNENTAESVDSLETERQQLEESQIHIVNRIAGLRDSISQVDSLIEINRVNIDTVMIARVDSVSTIIDSMRNEIKLIKKLQDSIYIAKIDSLTLIKDQYINAISLYEKEFIPFSYFLKGWLYKNVILDTVRTDSVVNLMSSQYPGSKYTNAIQNMMSGETIEFATIEDKNRKILYEEALVKMYDDPDSCVAILEEIEENTYGDEKARILYTKGLCLYRVMNDTIKARAVFDSIKANHRFTEFVTEINKFYDGTKFLSLDRLPLIVQWEEAREAAIQDSLKASEAEKLKDSDSELKDKDSAEKKDLKEDFKEVIKEDWEKEKDE